MIGFGESVVHGVELEVHSVGCCQFVIGVVVRVAIKLDENGLDTKSGFVFPEIVNECDGANALGP